MTWGNETWTELSASKSCVCHLLGFFYFQNDWTVDSGLSLCLVQYLTVFLGICILCINIVIISNDIISTIRMKRLPVIILSYLSLSKHFGHCSRQRLYAIRHVSMLLLFQFLLTSFTPGNNVLPRDV